MTKLSNIKNYIVDNGVTIINTAIATPSSTSSCSISQSLEPNGNFNCWKVTNITPNIVAFLRYHLSIPINLMNMSHIDIPVYFPSDCFYTLKGNTVNGSPIITNISDTSQLKVGMTVLGQGLNTSVIVSIDSPTQVTINTNATQNLTQVILSFSVIASFTFYTSKSTSWSTDMRLGINIDGTSGIHRKYSGGWNNIRIYNNRLPADSIQGGWSADGADSLQNVASIEIAFKIGAGLTLGNMYFGNVTYNSKSIPKAMFNFDDGWKEVYDNVFNDSVNCHWNNYGLKGNVGVISGSVGHTGYMTLSNLQSLYNAGWDLGNHTQSHLDLTSLNASDLESQISTCDNFLSQNGFTRGANVMVCPYNAYNDTVLAAEVLSGKVMGYAPVSKSINPFSIYDSHYPTNKLPRINLGNLSTWGDGTSNDIKPYVDRALKTGETLAFYLHRPMADGLVDSDGNKLKMSVFNSLLDYLVANKIEVMTNSQFYAQLNDFKRRLI